jgi:hypothetical protein
MEITERVRLKCWRCVIHLFNIQRSKIGIKHVDIERVIYSSSSNNKIYHIVIYTLENNII